MNEQLQQALAAIITKALESAEAAQEFVLAEMPDVIRQLLVWHFTKGLIVLIACLSVAVILAYISRKAYVRMGARELTEAEVKERDRLIATGYDRRSSFEDRRLSQLNGAFREITFFVAFFSGVAAIIVALSAILNSLYLLQIWLAPKVYLIEYAADLVR